MSSSAGTAFRVPFRLRFAALALLALVSWPRMVRAQPYQYPPGPALADERVAYAMAVGATAVPMAAGVLLARNDWQGIGIALFTAGFAIGPSAGELYSGSVGLGLGTAATRLVGALALVLGFWDQGCADCDVDARSDRRLLLAGWALLGGGTALSLIDTHFAVHRHNRTVTGRRSTQGQELRLDPELILDQQGLLASGARLQLRF